MPSSRVNIDLFNQLRQKQTLLDVRTQQEYQKGHIPGAISLELFDRSERSLLGKMFADKGQEPAIKLGLDIVNPKIQVLMDQIESMVTGTSFCLHCWRGGMRSESVSWLAAFGLNKNVSVLEGGYKSYRNWVLSQFDRKYHFLILGGYTGSGKTELIHQLKLEGEQVLDLEGIANHRGSAFGSLGLENQPSQQQFENRLADKLAILDASRPIWIEDESRRIGACMIPDQLFKWKNMSETIFLDLPFEYRVDRLLEGYGSFDISQLISSTKKLERRLGGKACSNVIKHLESNEIRRACEILLKYYDKSYKHSLEKNKEGVIKHLSPIGRSTKELCHEILSFNQAANNQTIIEV